jgi:condensin complex subunit 2
MGEGASTGHANADMSAFLDYGDQLVDQPKKVFSAPLKYAKTAKRVDVKKLKENIWKELIDLTDVCIS